MLAYFAGRRIARQLDAGPASEMPPAALVEAELTGDELALRATMSTQRWLSCLLLGWQDETGGP